MAESPTDLIRRALAEIEAGKNKEPGIMSPGGKESRMAAEQGHDGGRGNTRSNAPGETAQPEDVPDMHENSKGAENMAHALPAPSAGEVRSTLSGEAAASGELADIRRMAALKELERKPSSEGNKESNAPAPEAPAGTKVGDVKAPAKEPADRNKKAEFEGVPPFTKESLGGDGWGKAREKAKQMFAAKK